MVAAILDTRIVRFDETAEPASTLAGLRAGGRKDER
jgi:hypothetical protein